MDFFNQLLNGSSLTTAVDRLPNMYSRVGELDIFDRRPQATTNVILGYRNNEVVLLDPQSRSAPRQEANRETAKTVSFEVPSYKFGDVITPEDLQNIAAFAPGERRLELASEALNRRLLKVRKPHDISFEFIRMQALKGIIQDPTGDVLYNLFNEFGVSQTTIDFELDDVNTDVVGKAEDLFDAIAEDLRGDSMTHVHVLVDKLFSRQLRSHPSYEKYLTGHSAALQQIAASRQNGSDPNAMRSVMIGNVTFESYSGKAQNSSGNSVKFIADNTGHAFPMGTMDTFVEVDVPSNRLGQVNVAPSQEIFISEEPLKHDKGIDIDTESNKMCFCSRPEVLVKVVA